MFAHQHDLDTHYLPNGPSSRRRLLNLTASRELFKCYELDFIPADAAAFRAAARKAKLTLVGPKSGFLLQGEDRPGALAEVIAQLAAAAINVTACDAVAAGGGRYGALLWVKPQDVQQAARVLGAVK